MAGYSATPLAKKLGIKAGTRVRVSNAPADYPSLLAPLPPETIISNRISRDIDIWHFFTSSAAELKTQLPRLRRKIKLDGAIWVSWPKKSSGVPSSVTEDTIRTHALPIGLVDIKVCAVDETWSGLKLVIRKELRK
jgi:hypothetical protein